jgi:hypothetical protein
MYGLPKDLDLSFFVAKKLESIMFAAFNIYFHFEGNVRVHLRSTFQLQQKSDVDNHQIGIMQSLPVAYSTLMTLLELEVIAASGNEEGTLSLTFRDGQVLRFFETTKAYEEYSFTDGQREYIV